MILEKGEIKVNETSIQFNSSQVFKYFSYLISDLRNFDRFCEYLLSIRGKFKLRSLLSTIFYEVGYSLDNNCEYDYMLYLPEVFYKELWRGQNLVLDLLKSDIV